MKKRIAIILIASLVLVALCGAILLRVIEELSSDPQAMTQRQTRQAAPVEVAPIDRGPIQLIGVFSGTLEPAAQVQVAAKVDGRIQSMDVDLSDPVQWNQVIAVLDSEEFVQSLRQAQAEMAVAAANLTAAQNALEIAEREMQRQSTLREQGIASDTQFDTVRADLLAAQSQVKVAQAQVQRAGAAQSNAKTQLDHTKIRAVWDSESKEPRYVSGRMVESGDTITANTPLISIVQLDPIKAVLYISERDYARLQPGQDVTLRVDAYPGQDFTATVTRISPVFESSSRQARVELAVPNPGRLLKPGMFVRASTVLDRVEDTLIVPETAIVQRGDKSAVFLVDAAGKTAKLVPVTTGITNSGRIQVSGDQLEGRVVTLGQQLLDDGSAIVITNDKPDEKSNQAGDR